MEFFSLNLADNGEASWYGKSFGADASREQYTAYQDYREYIEESNQSGVIRREVMASVYCVSLSIWRVLARRHADGVAMKDDQLLGAVQEHDGYVVGGDDPPSDLAEQVEKAVTMRPEGY